MFSTLTSSSPKEPPGYDLNSIFRPFTSEAAENAKTDPASRLNARQGKSLFNIELTRFPKLCGDEPLMSWLLRASGIVPDHVMRDAIEVSRKGDLTPFEILSLSGRISHSDMRAVERAIQYIEAGAIYRDFAAIALSFACHHFIEFDDALWDLGLHPSNPFSNFRLYELLENCGMFSQQELLAVRQECLSRGVTLGFALMKNNMMSGQLLKVLLECLAAVNSNKLQYHDLVLTVISILRDTDTMYGVADGMTHEARLVSQVPISTNDRALGNLLMCSNLVQLEDIVFCLEIALEDRRSLGEVLADFLLVDPIVMQAARSLSFMVNEKRLTARRSVELLEEVKRTGMPLQALFNDGNSLTVMNGVLTPVAMTSIA
ncbi:hypothetical protein KF913_14250 [Candidatus Obscuribacterales bacterium]|nr:hypothetical protein [Candidatus Obscuribacterales bacterium]